MTRIGSKKSLVYKLGIKDGFKVYMYNTPGDFHQVLGRLPKNVLELEKPTDGMEFIIMFVTAKKELNDTFKKMMEWLANEGILWVCWPKESSGIKSDLNGRLVRDVGVNNGMAEVKVSSINDVWSGLKFVKRTKEK